MGAFDIYTGLPLRGGFLLKSVRQEAAPMVDALNRPAFARTAIIGMTLEIQLAANLSAEEISVTLYHEVLEAVAVAAQYPPAVVCEFNEAGFESAARRMHGELGAVNPAALNRMLEFLDSEVILMPQ